MSELDRRLAEDRALRDAALALFKADLAFIRTDLSQKGVGERIADRLGDGARDMLDEAVDYAEANTGKVAAGVAAVILWFARGPIMEAIAGLIGMDEEEEEPAGDHGRSRSKRSRTKDD